MSAPKNQIACQSKGTALELLGLKTLSTILNDTYWRDHTAAEKREADALCSGVVTNNNRIIKSRGKLLRSVKFFAQEHHRKPNSEAVDRFVIGIMRMSHGGIRDNAFVEPEIGQAAGPSTLPPSNRNGKRELATMNVQANVLGNSLLETLLDACRNYTNGGLLETLLEACLNYPSDSNHSDTSSTVASEVEVPMEINSRQTRRVETVVCNCQGHCHHMDKAKGVLTGAPATNNVTNKYQGERTGDLLSAIMMAVMSCVKSILRKIFGRRNGGKKQDVEQNADPMSTGNVARS